MSRLRAGLVPLRVALAVFLAFIALVSVWTWRSTHPEVVDGRQTIVFWGSAAQLGDGVFTLIHRFEQLHPRYRVVMSSAVARDLTGDAQRLLTAVAGGVPPDLVFFDRFAVAQWADRHALLDLRPMLAEQDPKDPERLDLDHYYPWAVAEGSYGPPGSGSPNGIYGIPCSADIRLLWTNLTLLRQEGLVDPVTGQPRPPRTWEELREYNKRLSRYKIPGDPGSGLTRLGFAPAYGNSWLYIYAFQAGGNLLSEDGTRVTMDSPAVVRGLRFMCDCYDDIGGVQQAIGFQDGFQSGPLDPFLRGQVAMKIDGSWCLDNVAQFAPDDLDWTVSPAPIPADRLAAGESPITWAGGFALVVPATARCPQGAFELIRFLRTWDSIATLETAKREAAESQGHAYIPSIQPDRTAYHRLVQESVAGGLKDHPRYRDAVLTCEAMLDHTLIRPVTAVGQLLWNQHADATDAAEHHQLQAQARAAGQDEVAFTLHQYQMPVQAGLQAQLAPLKGPVVDWEPYLLAYAVAVALVLGAIILRAWRQGGSRLREAGAGLLFASPWLLGFAVLMGGPIVFSMVASFTSYDVLTPATSVGLGNYREVVHDPLFWKSLGNTVFMLIRIPLVMAVGLAIALLLNQGIRGLSFYRTAFYLPVVMPVVASSLLWLWVFNPSQGFLTQVVNACFDSGPGSALSALLSWLSGHSCHLQAPEWLEDRHWTKPSLILMNVWTAGGSMIIWLAGLQAIPRQLYEAAQIDGAGPFQRFRHITLPMLSPYILFNLVTGMIGTMQVFSEAYIMSDNGKPEHSLLFYALYLFDQAFQYFRIGYASALAWILFLIVLTLTMLQLWVSRRWIHYERG